MEGSQDLTPWRTVLLQKLTVLQLVKNSPHFIGPEISLPCAQRLAICPYPKPDESSSWPHILFLEDSLQYYPLIYAYVFQVVPSFRFPTQIRTLLSSLVQNKQMYTTRPYTRRRTTFRLNIYFITILLWTKNPERKPENQQNTNYRNNKNTTLCYNNFPDSTWYVWNTKKSISLRRLHRTVYWIIN
jgi:hypothetical protein